MSLNEGNSKNILIVGIGNPLRCDDGVGHYVAECIEAKGLIGVKVWVTQQLQVEDLDRMLEFNRIILVDASINGPFLDFRPIQKLSGQMLASSHHLSAETFVNLASSIYHKELNVFLCSIKGESFEVGNKISPTVLKRAEEAIGLIINNLYCSGMPGQYFRQNYA